METDVRTLVVGTLGTNCYLLWEKKTREVVIIDPGDDAPHITDTINTLGLIPVAVCMTHGHFDHILGVWELMKNFAVPFYGNPKDQFLLTRMQTTAKKYVGRSIVEPVPVLTDELHNGKSILFGTHRLTTIETPGHTPGGVSLYDKEAALVFCGDLLFADGGVGEWRHAYGDKKALDQSIKKVLSLPSHTRIFPGHGEETRVEKECGFHVCTVR